MRLGADPEVFLVNEQGKHISSIGYINAGKEHPFQIPSLPKGFTLQEDNVSLEFGIPPASNADEFVHHIQTVMQAGLSKCPKLKFSTLSCVVFDKDQLEHPLAHVFGCEPDYNAWTEEENVKPNPSNPAMRSAGGHVHIETKLNRFHVVRACDLFMGVPSVLMDDGIERKKLYGSAGACRPKPYGVEYRTLSNFWIFSPKLIKWVWRNTKKAVNFVDHLDLPIDAKLGKEIQSCINNNDKRKAEKLIKEFNLEVI